MEKNTKIILGLGAAIAAYLILKPKNNSNQTSIDNVPNQEPMSKEVPSPSPIVKKVWDDINDSQNLIYRYKVIKDVNFGSGYFNHGISFNSVAPKVGDIIEAKSAINLPEYMGGGIVYPYTICVSQPEGKECRDVFISYDALENLGQLIYT